MERLVVEVGATLVIDFRLVIAGQQETVIVSPDTPPVDRATTTVGNVVTAKTINEIPLNGRHFTDLSLLVGGAVAPSQAGFSSRPARGVGAKAINIAGNREESVGFIVNGVMTNNLTFGSLMFEPPVVSIQEFKVDVSALDAEYGHVSGAITNIVTRSGTDVFRGDGFEFFRNDALDARNFFEFNTPRPHAFSRNQYGGSLGGPIWRGRTFFITTFETFRQRQGVDLNGLVLSDAQRDAVVDPVVRQLLPLIPRANYFDATGTPRFVGSAPAVVDSSRWTLDLRHALGSKDRMQLFFGGQWTRNNEPTTQGTSIPGFGTTGHPYYSVLTVNETHTFGATRVNEARFGQSVLVGGTQPAALLNPADFGIGNGVTTPIGIPQMIVAGGLNFGGPAIYPQGRTDTSYVVNDTLTFVHGRHSMKAGGEFRHFINRNFAQGTGQFNFPSIAAFQVGRANAFNITLGERYSIIDQPAMSLFFQERVPVGDRLTLELGLRYEWHVTPTERDDHMVVFAPATASLLQVGVHVGGIYAQNNANVEPRAGLAWDVAGDGRTVLRAAYARAVDQPSTTAVRDTAGNPPFATPLTATGAIPISDALSGTMRGGLAPATIDPAFRNASLQSWNINVQRQIARDAALTVGYMGSHGSDLRLARNLNQPVGGALPFPAVSASSPILPNTPLGNITQIESTGFSDYDALWASMTRRLSRGLQVDASYTWSKSLDTNSLNSSGFALQNGYDVAGNYGPSDFDARHRFVLSAVYALPFTGSAWTRGWQLSTVVQAQSGNPFNIVTTNSGLNGTANTVRPDVTGPITIIGSVDRWFDTSAFTAADHFGNLGRNALVGPAFNNTDVSAVKTMRRGAADMQVRLDVFDVFNHPNFASPGAVVGSPTFGKIMSTRLSTGEGGSSRQIQLAFKVSM
ncbi:MAG TPA: hypothetical protein VKH42_18345 [Vicinamibacterales bacterium]|nr:hypothetical protein [Vicinamibacterales bacterium]